MTIPLKQLGIRTVHAVHVAWWFFCRPHTRGVKCLVFYHNQFLLVQLSYAHQKWTFPGGGVKRSETFLDAAHRELYEETGLAVDELEYFATYTQKIEYKNDTVQCFVAQVASPEVTIDNVEITAAQWCAADNLPDQCAPSVLKILKLYQAYREESMSLAHRADERVREEPKPRLSHTDIWKN